MRGANYRLVNTCGGCMHSRDFSGCNQDCSLLGCIRGLADSEVDRLYNLDDFNAAAAALESMGREVQESAVCDLFNKP